MLLSLPAFFLVKNAIERDVQTGVGQIIATTPITRWLYTMGKMWSNFFLLMSIVGVLIVSALAMQLIRGEDYTIDPVNLLLPFMYSTLPTMALVASIAIFFESVPLLSKGLGNFIYFVLWIISLKLSTTATHSSQDIFGISPILTRMSSEANARSSSYRRRAHLRNKPVKRGFINIRLERLYLDDTDVFRTLYLVRRGSSDCGDGFHLLSSV